MSNVAQEILAQLGGRRFIAMTGAKSIVNCGDGIRFKLPTGFSEVNGKKTGINLVHIRLTDRDDYTVRFGKMRGVNLSWLKEIDGVYCDMLQDIFTTETGLATKI